MAQIQGGSNTANVANVNAEYDLQVALPLVPAYIGGVRNFSENDPGTITGVAQLRSPETSTDYRLRIEPDTLWDTETFDYAAQNTGKHNCPSTTMAFAFSGGFYTTNSTSITTLNTSVFLRTYQYFPLWGASSLYIEFNAALSAALTTNTTIDFGLYQQAGTPFTPTDGVYFRINGSGFFGVINFNGAETTTSVFTFTHTINQSYKFTITFAERTVQFWIDDVLMATLPVQIATGQPCLSASLPLAIRHSIGGVAAGSALSFKVSDYTVSTGGFEMALPWQVARAMAGQTGYQGQSGGTMGSTENYVNNTNPTALVPTNTTAAAGSLGLGGQTWETDTVAVTTDCIIFSYQNPAGTAAIPGKTLLVSGVKVDSYIQTGLTGGGYNAQWCVAYGHTALPLNTGEAATTKAPRRVVIGSNSVASGAVALTQLQTLAIQLANPIVVNPGEFIAIVKKKVGTAPSAGVVAHMVMVDALWV